jgi:hypothetical protein
MQLKCNLLKNQTWLTMLVCTTCTLHHISVLIALSYNYNIISWFSNVAFYLLNADIFMF